MTWTLERPGVRPDGRLLTLVAALGASLVVGVALNWWVAVGLVALGIILAIFPLEPFPALVTAAGLATFVDGSGGNLSRELSIVTLVLLYSVLCVVAAHARNQWKLPRSSLTTAILLFEASTLLAAAHGLWAGHERRYLGLELLPLLSLTIALMAGGLRLNAANLRVALWVFNIVSLGHVALGFFAYGVNRIRVGGLWFTPIPGLMALLLFNLALREERRLQRLGWILLMAANLLHQLISLTRGYWMGLAAGFLVSCLIYVGRSPGARLRARQLLGVAGWMILLVSLGSGITGAYFGWGDVASMFGTRLASSFGMEHTSESASNFERLLEWVASIERISEAPWFGHGLGLTLHIHHPVYSLTSTQWYIHQLYLWIWLKEGLLGLALLIAVLVVAIRLGQRNARRLLPGEAGWAAGAAATTAYTAALGFTNYPMAMVNSTFLMALLWGIALALGHPPRWRFVWRSENPKPTSGADA